MEAVTDFTDRIKKATEEAKAALTMAADDMARFYDAHHADAPVYKVGDKVWLDAKDIKTKRPTKKFDDKWYGPFEITKVVNRNAYKLRLPTLFKSLHPVFHVVKLRPYISDPIAARPPPPPPPAPELVDGHEEHEIESILDSKYRWNRLWYFVSWKGYDNSENAWVRDSDVHAAELITEFHNTHPSAPRRLQANIFAGLVFRPYENFTDGPRRTTEWTDGRQVGTTRP